MKKLVIKNPSYQYLETAFKEWLDVLGYGSGTVGSMPVIVREFLHHLEKEQVQGINNLHQKNIKSYHAHISTRANQNRGGGLSNNYINKHLQAVEKFLGFLAPQRDKGRTVTGHTVGKNPPPRDHRAHAGRDQRTL
jgi:integrase/recombinase XerD